MRTTRVRAASGMRGYAAITIDSTLPHGNHEENETEAQEIHHILRECLPAGTYARLAKRMKNDDTI